MYPRAERIAEHDLAIDPAAKANLIGDIQAITRAGLRTIEMRQVDLNFRITRQLINGRQRFIRHHAGGSNGTRGKYRQNRIILMSKEHSTNKSLL